MNKPLLQSALAFAVMSAMSAAVHAEGQMVQENVTKLETIVVTTAGGFEQNIADAPASISVITGEELQKKSYTDVIDAVKNMPGVSVQGGGNNKEITIRGMGASYTKYLIDGRPVSAGRAVNGNGTDGGKIGAYLPPIDMIERIEVVRGPMSSLYGSDAMGGVINIITKKASSSDWHGSISPEYTKSNNDYANDSYGVGFYAAGPLIKDKLSLSLDGNFQGNDESDYVGGEGQKSGSSESEKKVRKLGTGLVWNVDEHNDIGLRYDFTGQQYTTTLGKSVGAASEASTNENEKEMYTLTHKAHYDTFNIDSYYQDETTKKVYSGAVADEKQEDLKVFNTQGTFFLGNHTLTAGGQYQTEKITDTTNGLASVTGLTTLDRWLFALYAENEWNITDDFALTLGARYNKDEYFGGEITPRIYGIYHLNDVLTLKGGISTGYKQPTISQISEGFGSRTGKGSAVIIGNPDLSPEKSTSYELGFNFSDPELGLSSSLMVFKSDFKDKIVEDRLCDTPGTTNSSPVQDWKCSANGKPYRFVSQMKNVAEAEMKGIEFALDYDVLYNLRLSTSYTYTDSEQKSGEFKGQPLNKMPKHMLNAGVDYDVSDRWNTWMDYNYRGKTSDYLSRTSMSSGTPAYGTIDAGAVYKASEKLSLTAGVYNLANKEVTNSEYDIVLDGRRYTVGMNIRF
ncbi:TonB-dependent receptor [Acinetobacter sp. ANC 4177]|jgi:outer membrane receptor for ferrienterochelin and colicins|uniref:TonB-dependent receptor domain-containing protein n=1 Tax=Acinetobacter sp. ANC 4177 TaxID=2529838 RepID=UPI00103C3EE3|nr:TonB-dependent receptor [Acinetobacter sp. ANC 4177]QXW25312.1 TonB-dependent receptor [Acinetobacter johnsonii]TCB75713.1 TonB-dependent receptor [Acinetobacter sp. ANC 4177]